MHQLRRPPVLSGTGPLEVYRAISPVVQSLLQTPQQFVRQTTAFAGLATSMTATTAAALQAAQVPNVAKVWTELAFERVRMDVVPDAPSRLDSVYATPDVFEAFSFTEETGQAHFVYRGVVQDGVPWQLVDMGSFAVEQPATLDEVGFQAAWDAACDRAIGYWMTGQATPTTPFYAEILVGGPILLDGSRLRLLDTMAAEQLLVR